MTPPKSPDRVVHYTTTELANGCGVSNSTIRRLVLSGRLTPAMTTPGGYRRFTQTQLDVLRAEFSPADTTLSA